MDQRENTNRAYRLYLAFVVTLGISLLGLGLVRSWHELQMPIFLLLLLLAAVASAVTTSTSVGTETSITYEVQNAISISAAPLFGPLSATIVTAVAMVTMWLLKPAGEGTWRRSWRQLAFNVSMHSIAVVIAGTVMMAVIALFESSPILSILLSWPLGAIVYGQANIWLLIGVVYFQSAGEIDPWQMWNENRWAMVLDALVMAIGGALLTYSAYRFDWLGIAIFFLPILLSAFSFRLYVRQMQQHMENLEDIVAERTRELRQLNEEKNAFLAVLSHDMKTPLTSIGIYAGLLERNPDLLREQPETANIIGRNQKVLLDIVENIVDLEKLSKAGEMPLDVDTFELNPVLLDAVEVIRPQAVEKGITLNDTSPHEDILVAADRGNVTRILLNLLSNAVKYTPEGGEVSLRAYRNGKESVVFSVSDTGYGIPEEELPHIFERFRRVEKHKSVATGTGLGLTVTKALVEGHGGTIFVESSEGEGSTFTTILPIVVNHTHLTASA